MGGIYLRVNWYLDYWELIYLRVSCYVEYNWKQAPVKFLSYFRIEMGSRIKSWEQSIKGKKWEKWVRESQGECGIIENKGKKLVSND